jgi:LptA/(LptD N-terminal domain) LPS transport protein
MYPLQSSHRTKRIFCCAFTIFLMPYFCLPIFADFLDDPSTPLPKTDNESKLEKKGRAKGNAPKEIQNTKNNSFENIEQAPPLSTPQPSPSKPPANTGASGTQPHNVRAPIETESDLLEGSYSKGRIKLTGNVKITQADTILKSETAEVFARENSR